MRTENSLSSLRSPIDSSLCLTDKLLRGLVTPPPLFKVVNAGLNTHAKNLKLRDTLTLVYHVSPASGSGFVSQVPSLFPRLLLRSSGSCGAQKGMVDFQSQLPSRFVCGLAHHLHTRVRKQYRPIINFIISKHQGERRCTVGTVPLPS